MTLGADVHDGRANIYRWRVAQLDWVAWDGSLTTGALTIGVVDQGAAGASNWLVTQSRLTVLTTSGTTSASGNTTLITPASGKALQIHYLSYNPAAAVECAFRFGAAGSLFLRNSLTSGGAVVAKDFGEFKNIQGAVNEALVLNLSGAVATIWNAFYREV